MKALFTCCFTMLLLTANAQHPEQPLVVVANSILADMTWNIIGDAGQVTAIVPLGQVPSGYKLNNADRELLNSADLILRNDLGMEPWLDEWVAKTDNKAKVKTISTGIQPLDKADGQPDPFAWMNPRLGLIYLDNIKDVLSAWSPADEQMFAFNHGVYRQQLLDMDAAIVAQIPQARRLLRTSQVGLSYYGKRFGIQVMQTKNDRHELLFVHSLSAQDGPAATYLELLHYDTEVITMALEKPPAPDAPKSLSGRMALILGGLTVFLLMGVIVYVIRRFNR